VVVVGAVGAVVALFVAQRAVRKPWLGPD
jgi:hypothetical protein